MKFWFLFRTKICLKIFLTYSAASLGTRLVYYNLEIRGSEKSFYWFFEINSFNFNLLTDQQNGSVIYLPISVLTPVNRCLHDRRITEVCVIWFACRRASISGS